MIEISAKTLHRMEAAAREACQRSYSPYSGFPVGAAVLTASGEIFAGCNIENVSFSMTCCAERTAIYQAVTAGFREIAALVLYTPTEGPVSPCGACRQVLSEFGPKAVVVSLCRSSEHLLSSVEDLLPAPFTSPPH